MATLKGKKAWMTRYLNEYEKLKMEEVKILKKIFTKIVKIKGKPA